MFIDCWFISYRVGGDPAARVGGVFITGTVRAWVRAAPSLAGSEGCPIASRQFDRVRFSSVEGASA